MDTNLNSGVAGRIREAFGVESPEEKQDKQALIKTQQAWKYLSNARRRTEYEWWMNDQFYQGEQYVAFNMVTRKITRTGNQDDKVIINKIQQNGRYVISWLNQEHPQSKVLPGVQEEAAYIKAKKEEHLLDYWYDALKQNKKTKQVTLDAYKYKVGFFKVGWDGDAIAPTSPYSGGVRTEGSLNGEIFVDRVDPWEVYWDPMAHDVPDMSDIIHAVRRPIDVLKANPNYKNTDKLTADNKLASSYIREAEMKMQTVGGNQFAPSGKDSNGTVIVREHFSRQWNKEKGKFEIRVITSTDTGILLRDCIWKMDCMPFVLYTADVQGSLLDGGSPVRSLRSPQRAINQIASIIHENARVMGKINWRIPRGSNVNVITDEVGQFLEYDPSPGGVPEQVAPAGLPAFIPNHLQQLLQLLDDLGGNHSASYGKSPGSKASGELVNKLQEGDSNNLAMMRDNLDDTLSQLAKLMLLTFKANAKTDRYVRLKDPDAIGQYQFVSIKPGEISAEDEVQVKSGSNMPYSLADKQDLFLNLYKEKAIDAKTLLKALEMPDLDNVAGSQQMDIDRAVQENKDLLQGKDVGEPVKGEDNQTHMEVHTQLIKSEMFKKADPVIQDGILQHYEAHIDLNYKLAQITNSLNVEPIKRSEAVMWRPNSFTEMTPIERTQALSHFGMQSDALEIQQRGGLAVQDPTQAELQAKMEDNKMMDGSPCQTSIADNHQVHIQTHTQIMETQAFQILPEVIKNLFNQHVTAHMKELASQTPTPGLTPQPNYDIPSNAQVIKPPKKPSMQDAQQQGLLKNAMNPQSPIQRPLAPHELLQHPNAVKNQLTSEKLNAQEAEKAKQEKAQTAVKANPSKRKKVAKA